MLATASKVIWLNLSVFKYFFGEDIWIFIIKSGCHWYILTKIYEIAVLGNKNQNNTTRISSTARLNKHVGVKMFKVLLLICSHMSILAASTRAKVTTWIPPKTCSNQCQKILPLFIFQNSTSTCCNLNVKNNSRFIFY